MTRGKTEASTPSKDIRLRRLWPRRTQAASPGIPRPSCQLSFMSTPSPPDAGIDNSHGIPVEMIPGLNINGNPLAQADVDADERIAWGANFWVTLVNPQNQLSFYACPATGEVSWDPPAGNFVLPANPEGEWWEIEDESRGGLPYYYQTKTGETVWERPEGFVIPLGILQNTTALGRRLSKTAFSNYVRPYPRRSRSYARDISDPTSSSSGKPGMRRTTSTEQTLSLSRPPASNLPPIPGSPNTSDVSAHTSIPRKSTSTLKDTRKDSPPKDNTPPRNRTSKPALVHHMSQPQSLTAAVEMLANSQPPKNSSPKSSPSSGSSRRPKQITPPSPTRPLPSPPPSATASVFRSGRSASTPNLGGKPISSPIANREATMNMSPVKRRQAGKPIPVERTSGSSPPSSVRPILPHELVSDIQQFSESDFARQYFATHRTGFIFRRKVPVAQMMTWQKNPLSTPLLTFNRTLSKDAVRVFKIIQRIMGDRERERDHVRATETTQSSTTVSSISTNLLEEERWLLGTGLAHGELRDEIYCQVMKQLTRNPNQQSIFRGWQLLCVLLMTFPPSKNFETYLAAFIQPYVTQANENRVDVMAKHCLKRLGIISKKGPRGKPPTLAEIESASDAAFNPSIFGESLDAIMRLQERTYSEQKVPIVLPFLADGILALGGMKSEGIFRVPGDGDVISDLRLRIDRGYYTLDGIDDPNVLASLLKFWLRELCDPLVPEEMYNECITIAKDPEACIRMVERLPTINRRVVLFVISFLQQFLDERTMEATKMTPANLALVMAPNLLRCKSESMAVVFTNSQFEQTFIYNLLLHLRCDDVDKDYIPNHGQGPTLPTSPNIKTTRARRNPYH